MEEKSSKPFPWMCPACRQKTVSPVQRDYSIPAELDGASYEVTVRDFVPTCVRCGMAIITGELSDRISDELRRLAGLLTPERIRAEREALEMSAAHLADALHITEAALIRWESGIQLQPRALDLLLRLYFDSEEVRQRCAIAASLTAVPAGAATLAEPRIAG